MGSRIQLKESGIPLTIGIQRESFTVVGIQNPSYTDKDWNSVRRIRNPRLGIQVPKLSRIALLGTKEKRKIVTLVGGGGLHATRRLGG